MNIEYLDEERNPSFYDDPFFILPRSLPNDEKEEISMNKEEESCKNDEYTQYETVTDDEVVEAATKLMNDYDEAFKELAK